MPVGIQKMLLHTFRPTLTETIYTEVCDLTRYHRNYLLDLRRGLDE